jgi:hypothetical protein
MKHRCTLDKHKIIVKGKNDLQVFLESTPNKCVYSLKFNLCYFQSSTYKTHNLNILTYFVAIWNFITVSSGVKN